MKSTSLALIIVLAVFSGKGALACSRTNPNPMDTTCTPSTFLNQTLGSVQYYAMNGPARWVQITACTHPTPGIRENPQWCAAAMQAQRLSTGAR